MEDSTYYDSRASIVQCVLGTSTAAPRLSASTRRDYTLQPVNRVTRGGEDFGIAGKQLKQLDYATYVQ